LAFTAADMIVHVGADVKDAVTGINQVGSSVSKGAAGIGRASLLMGGAAGAIIGGFGFAANSAMNFEGAMADVSASLGTTGTEFNQLSSLALKIGADTAFSATQGAQAIEELGKAGVSVTDILGGAGMAAAQLASATGSDIPTAANVMSNAMNAFSLDGTQAVRVADVMTAALNESSLSMGDFAQGMASTGTIAASLGIPIEDTAGALAIFSNYGMSGADAGTSLTYHAHPPGCPYG
jgi:TP901 family phage tail tape measure protein